MADVTPRPLCANGPTEEEIVEASTRLAFLAGRPRALSAIDVAQHVVAEDAAA